MTPEWVGHAGDGFNCSLTPKARRHGALKYWNLCLECHHKAFGVDGRTRNRWCAPPFSPCPRLPVGELFVRQPPPELAPWHPQVCLLIAHEII